MKALVIVAPGLHLGYLGCYGNDWIETPALDRLAAEGVVFDHHYSDCPDAEKAACSWRTGRYHFPLPEVDDVPPSVDRPDLLTRLRQGDVMTALVSPRGPTSAFTAGWDVQKALPSGKNEDALRTTLAAVRAILDDLSSPPHWLLWVELAVLAPPWDVPPQFHGPPEMGAEDFDETLPPIIQPACGPLGEDTTFLCLQSGYARAVRYLDFILAEIQKELERRRLKEEVFILITTDAGTVLGEHGLVGAYRPWLHEELVHLPFLIRLPQRAQGGRRVAALTQPVDLMPTLLELFQLPAAAVHGHSLTPLLRGEAAPVRNYACTGLRIGEAVEWALRTPEWAFLLPLRGETGDPPRGPQLYVKPDDRWEVNNVIQHHPELAQHLEQVLRDFVRVHCG